MRHIEISKFALKHLPDTHKKSRGNAWMPSDFRTTRKTRLHPTKPKPLCYLLHAAAETGFLSGPEVDPTERFFCAPSLHTTSFPRSIISYHSLFGEGPVTRRHADPSTHTPKKKFCYAVGASQATLPAPTEIRTSPQPKKTILRLRIR